MAHRANLSDHDKAVLERLFNPNLPYGDYVENGEQTVEENVEEESAEIKEAKRHEEAGVQAAESGDLITALDHFNQAVNLTPARASGYNNRAQALRLKGDTIAAMHDLNQAVALSEGKGNAACQAFVQRGLLHRLEGQADAAVEDFKAAAQLGSQFAKQQVVAMNPYAAMCNAMLREVITKLQAGEAIEDGNTAE